MEDNSELRAQSFNSFNLKDASANWKVLLLNGNRKPQMSTPQWQCGCDKWVAGSTCHRSPLVDRELPLSWAQPTWAFLICLPTWDCTFAGWPSSSRVQCLPAHQAEPGEAVVEGVTTSHGALAVLGGGSSGGCVRHVCGAVVHLPHEVQPLPARSIDGGAVEKRTTWAMYCTALYSYAHWFQSNKLHPLCKNPSGTTQESKFNLQNSILKSLRGTKGHQALR